MLGAYKGDAEGALALLATKSYPEGGRTSEPSQVSTGELRKSTILLVVEASIVENLAPYLYPEGTPSVDRYNKVMNAKWSNRPPGSVKRMLCKSPLNMISGLAMLRPLVEMSNKTIGFQACPSTVM